MPARSISIPAAAPPWRWRRPPAISPVSAGASLGLTDCLNFGSPERPEILWQFKEAVAGIAEACRALDIPVVGGNVSFYNETLGQAILPTPVIGMAGLLEDAEARGTQWFQEAGDRIALIGAEAVSLGGSSISGPCTGGWPVDWLRSTSTWSARCRGPAAPPSRAARPIRA